MFEALLLSGGKRRTPNIEHRIETVLSELSMFAPFNLLTFQPCNASTLQRLQFRAFQCRVASRY